VAGFEERAGRLETDIRDSRKRGVELEAKGWRTPSRRRNRYHHLVKRQSEIEEKLDLTKNQAPVQAESATDVKTEEEELTGTNADKNNRRAQRTAVRV